MYYLIGAVILPMLIVAIRIVIVHVQLSKSEYCESSGNTLWNVVFNKGNYGEFLTYRILEKCGESKILCNVYLPKQNDETTEVDLISINSKGIFVYESKNYSGWIFGDEKNKNWTQSVKGGKKYKLYNPIFQNNGHIRAIDKYLEKSYSESFLSYIVFSERCELKKITVTSSNVRVINRYRLKKTLMNDIITLTDRLNDEEINQIYEKLKLNTLVTSSERQKHIEYIKSKY